MTIRPDKSDFTRSNSFALLAEWFCMHINEEFLILWIQKFKRVKIFKYDYENIGASVHKAFEAVQIILLMIISYIKANEMNVE